MFIEFFGLLYLICKSFDSSNVAKSLISHIGHLPLVILLLLGELLHCPTKYNHEAHDRHDGCKGDTRKLGREDYQNNQRADNEAQGTYKHTGRSGQAILDHLNIRLDSWKEIASSSLIEKRDIFTNNRIEEIFPEFSGNFFCNQVEGVCSATSHRSRCTDNQEKMPADGIDFFEFAFAESCNNHAYVKWHQKVSNRSEKQKNESENEGTAFSLGIPGDVNRWLALVLLGASFLVFLFLLICVELGLRFILGLVSSQICVRLAHSNRAWGINFAIQI